MSFPHCHKSVIRSSTFKAIDGSDREFGYFAYAIHIKEESEQPDFAILGLGVP